MLKYTNEETVVFIRFKRSDLFILCADTYFVLFEYKVKIYNRRQTGKV